MTPMKYLLLSLNIIFILSQDLSKNEQLIELINCVNSTTINDNEIKTKILDLYDKNDSSIFRVIGEFLVTKTNEMKKCIPKKNIEVNNNFEPKNFNDLLKDKYNWEDFTNCLKEKIANLAINGQMTEQSVIDLIQEINQENFALVIRDLFRLRRFGNNVVNECHSKLILS